LPPRRRGSFHRPLTAPCSGRLRRQPALCSPGHVRFLAFPLGAQPRATPPALIRERHACSSGHDKCPSLRLGHLVRRAAPPLSTRAPISLRTSRQVFLSQARLAAAVPPRPLAHWRRTRRQVRLPDGPGEARRKRFAEHPRRSTTAKGGSRSPVTSWHPVPPRGHARSSALPPRRGTWPRTASLRSDGPSALRSRAGRSRASQRKRPARHGTTRLWLWSFVAGFLADFISERARVCAWK